MKAARNVFLSLLRNITVITTKRCPLASLSEAPGVQSPGSACTLPGPISPPLALRGTARVSCLWLLAHSLQDTPKGETHDEYAWKTSLPIVRGHSSWRNRQGYRFRAKTHPRTGGGAGKPETPCFPPSSSWEEYNSALRQPPRKLLWEQTLLLTIQKWDKSISNPLEKLGVSTTSSETLHSKGAPFSLLTSESRKTLHFLSDQKTPKRKWEFLWKNESWQVRYHLCWQDSKSYLKLCDLIVWLTRSHLGASGYQVLSSEQVIFSEPTKL